MPRYSLPIDTAKEAAFLSNVDSVLDTARQLRQQLRNLDVAPARHGQALDKASRMIVDYLDDLAKLARRNLR